MRPDDAQVSVQTGREGWREGRRARRVARGKIKGGREVRIRLSQRMLELLSDFLARIMEHSLKKAFARDRDTLVFSFFLLPPLLRIHFFSHAHATPVLFFSFATFHSFCRIKIQSCSQTKEDRHCGVGNDGRKGLRCAHEGVIERERETEC